MANVYLSKDGLHFQYLVVKDQPFYTALIDQGYTESATPITEETETDDNYGEIKTIFPGSDRSADDASY